MEKKQKTCKKCGRPLPYGYKYSDCEACRNKKADNAKKIAGAVAGIGGIIVAVLAAFNGNRKK